MEKDKLVELAERCEAATGSEQAQVQSQRAILEAAWAAIHGALPRRNRGGDNPENRFIAMLDARAYESAAIGLMPKGRGLTLIVNAREGFSVATVIYGYPAKAATPALAICAAALRSHAQPK